MYGHATVTGVVCGLDCVGTGWGSSIAITVKTSLNQRGKLTITLVLGILTIVVKFLSLLFFISSLLNFGLSPHCLSVLGAGGGFFFLPVNFLSAIHIDLELGVYDGVSLALENGLRGEGFILWRIGGFPLSTVLTVKAVA